MLQCEIPKEFKSNITSVSAGVSFTCAIKNNSRMNCWSNKNIYFAPSDFQNGIETVSGKYDHICSLNSLGHLGCWGKDSNGETRIPNKLKYNIT